MNTTLSQQIQEIQKARMLVTKEATSINTSENLRAALKQMNDGLNDAASTIASLNLIKSLPESEQLEFLRNLKSL